MSDTDPPDTISALTPAQQAAVDAARALVGLSYPDPAYLAAVAPGETPERALEMGRESGCALLWRALNGGTAPYRDGSAFSEVWRLAGGVGWRPSGRVRAPELPSVGDAIVYDAAGAHPQHVDLCWIGDGQAVAGGQRTSDGRECVAIVTRRLAWTGGQLVDETTGRRVMALISPAEVA